MSQTNHEIGVLGGGAFGTALASMLASDGREVVLWARNRAVVEAVNTTHQHPDVLPDISLATSLQTTNDLALACRSNIVLCVTPAQTFAELANAIAPIVNASVPIVICAKGIDRDSGTLLHQVAEQFFANDQIAALSGPSFAADIATGLPTAVSLAAHNQSLADQLAQKISTPRFRTYASDDLIGVEAGGALKNVIALAVGIARGLNLGASAEAALITRGFAELRRLVLAMGGKAETVTGLSGLGDLILTCSSPQSRNFSYGMALGRREDLTNRPLAEGVASAAQACKIAQTARVEVPIIDTVTKVLAKDLSPQEAVSRLLARPLRSEHESYLTS